MVQHRCGNRWCNNLAHTLIDDKYYCKTCQPVKVKKAAAEKVEIMSATSTHSKPVMPLEIKNIGPGCTCKPKKWWEKFLDHFKSNTPPGCG